MKLENLTSRPLFITESWNDRSMTIMEETVVRPFVRDIERYITEEQLTVDQVKQIFAATEKASVEGGSNRTLVGKGVDAAKFIDQKINELGAALKQAGPVKNMDAKFKDLKAKISAENSDSKIVQGIQAVSDWAKANPGKASVAVAVLTIAASMAGGPLGGAIAGFLSRATKDLLQGADLSTAIGKSIKTGVYGFLAGMAFKYVTDNILDNLASASEAELDAMEQGFKQANYEQLRDLEFANAGLEPAALEGAQKIALQGNLNAFEYSYDTVMNADQLSQLRALEAAVDAAESFTPEHFASAAKLHDFMIGVQNNPENINLTALWNGLKSIPKDMLTDDQFVEIIQKFDQADAVMKAVSDLGGAAGAAIQGALQASDDKAKNAVQAAPVDPEVKQELEADAKETKQESYYVQRRPLSEGQVYLLFDKIAQRQAVMEGPMDLLKKGIGAVGKAASWAGKQTTEKITSAKLLASWKLEGSPGDSDKLAQFLQGQGVDPGIISKVYTDMKLPEPGAAQSKANIENIKSLIAKLNTSDREKVISHLEKSLGTA